jgi:hypothetical protein
MRIRENKLYELYLAYLENKKISAGQMRLAQISESLFEDFVMRLDNDPHFRTELSSIYLDLIYKLHFKLKRKRIGEAIPIIYRFQ